MAVDPAFNTVSLFYVSRPLIISLPEGLKSIRSTDIDFPHGQKYEKSHDNPL
jgi:hypothetical protein